MSGSRARTLSSIPDVTGDNKVLVSTASGVAWETVSFGANFNTNISNQVGYLATTGLTAAFTAPSTADQRYVIHSIHATNISAASNDLYIELEGSQYANTVISGNIPLPVGTSVEFLKRPKVLYPNDKINVKCTSNNAIHVLIVYEISSDTNLFGKGYHVATENVTYDAFVASANSVIESIQLTNYNSNTDIQTFFDVNVRTIWVNAANAVQGYFTYDLLVPRKSTVEVLGAPKVIPSGHKIQVIANKTDYIDVVVAGKLI